MSDLTQVVFGDTLIHGVANLVVWIGIFLVALAAGSVGFRR